jgi:hypothetical protein
MLVRRWRRLVPGQDFPDSLGGDGVAADRQLAAGHVVDHDPGQAANGLPGDRHDRLGELLADLRLLVIGKHALDYTAVDGRRLRPPLVV